MSDKGMDRDAFVKAMIAELSALDDVDGDGSAAAQQRGAHAAPDAAAGVGSASGGRSGVHHRVIDAEAARAAYDELCRDYPRLPATSLRELRALLTSRLRADPARGASVVGAVGVVPGGDAAGSASGGAGAAPPGGAWPSWLKVTPRVLSGAAHVAESATRDAVAAQAAAAERDGADEAAGAEADDRSLLRVRPGIDDCGDAVAEEAGALCAALTLKAARYVLSSTAADATRVLGDSASWRTPREGAEAVPVSESDIERAIARSGGAGDSGGEAAPEGERVADVEDDDDCDYAADDGRIAAGSAAAAARAGTLLGEGAADDGGSGSGGALGATDVVERAARLLDAAQYRALHSVGEDGWLRDFVTDDIVWCALVLFGAWHGVPAGAGGGETVRCAAWLEEAIASRHVPDAAGDDDASGVAVGDAAKRHISERWVQLLHLLRDRLCNRPVSLTASLGSLLAFYSSPLGLSGSARGRGAAGSLGLLNKQVQAHVSGLSAMSGNERAAAATATANRVVLGALTELCQSDAVCADKRARITLHVALMQMVADVVATVARGTAALRGGAFPPEAGALCSDALSATRVLQFCLLRGHTPRASATDVVSHGGLVELLRLLEAVWTAQQRLARPDEAPDSLLQRVVPDLHAEVSEAALHAVAHAEGALDIVAASAALVAEVGAGCASLLQSHRVAWLIAVAKAVDGAPSGPRGDVSATPGGGAPPPRAQPAPLSSMFAPPPPTAKSTASAAGGGGGGGAAAVGDARVESAGRVLAPASAKSQSLVASANERLEAQAEAVRAAVHSEEDSALSTAVRHAGVLEDSLRLMVVLRPFLVRWSPAAAVSGVLRRVDRALQASASRLAVVAPSAAADGAEESKEGEEVDAAGREREQRAAADADRLASLLRDARRHAKALAGLDGSGTGKSD